MDVFALIDDYNGLLDIVSDLELEVKELTPSEYAYCYHYNKDFDEDDEAWKQRLSIERYYVLIKD